MAYVIYDGSGNRQVEAKGDIEDLITIMGVDDHPLYAALANRKVTDPNPKTIEDALASANTSNYFAIDAAAPSATDTSRSLTSNWAQDMRVVAEVTDWQNAVAQYGMGRELQYQELKKTRELMRDVEVFLVSNQAAQAPTDANSRIAKMAGMGALITTNADSTGWTHARLTTMLLTLKGTYGSTADQAYCEGTAKTAVDGWTTNVAQRSMDPYVLIKEVRRVDTSYGTVYFHYHPHMPQDIAGAGAPHVLLLNMGLWQLCSYLPLSRKSLPDNGAGPSTQMRVACCPLTRAETGSAYWSVSS